MSEDRPESPPSSPKRTWLRRLLLALAALVLLVFALVLAIPPLVSSNWTRARIENALASATGKPASLRLLSLGWSDGLRLEGLRIGTGGLEDTDFLCSLERLHASFVPLAALGGDLRASVEISGLRLRHRLEPGRGEPEPPGPPAKPLPLLLKDTLAALRDGLKPGPRKGDVHLRVEITDVAARLELVASNGTLDLRDASLRLDAPGLDSGPIRMETGLTVLHNGTELAPIRLEAVLDGLVDPAGLLAPSRAGLSVKASAPGLALLAMGSLDKGLKADLHANLSELSAPLRSLAAGLAPELSGSLALGLTLSQPDPDHLALGLVLFADAVRATGGPLMGKSFGPLRMSLLQEADCDLKAGALRLPGSLDVMKRSSLRWQGQISGLGEGRPVFALGVRPLHLQVDELLGIARTWLPSGLGIGPAALDAQGIELKAALPEAPDCKPSVEIGVDGLVVEAITLSHASKGQRMSIGKTRLAVDSLRAVLPGAEPGRIELDAALALDDLRLAGPSPLRVKRLALPKVAAKVEGFAPNPAALFGFSGAVTLDAACEAQGVEASGTVQAPGMTSALTLRAGMKPAKEVTASLDSLGLDIPLLRVRQPGKRVVETSVSLRLTAPEVRLSGPGPLAPAVTDARLSLDAGRALRCAATASLSGRDVRGSGVLTLDAQRVFALAAPLLPRQAKGSGGVGLDWKFSASLPQGSPPAGREKLSLALKRLDFLKDFEAVLRLDNLSLDWPLAGTGGRPDDVLHLRGLSTPRPLRAATSGGLRESSLSGSLAFGPITDLPGVGALAKPLRGLLTVNAAQQDARSLQLSQVLRMDGMELDQSLRLALDRLDRVLDRDQDRLAAVLEHVDGTVAFDLKAALQPASTKARAGLSGAGHLEAGFDARLSGGRSLALAARLLSPGLDLRLGPDLSVRGLTSTLRLDKRFTLSPGLRCATPGEEAAQPLSEQVFGQLASAPPPSSGAARTLPHDFQSSGGALGLRQLQLKAGTLAVDVRDIELRLDASGPLPALRAFRAGLLGGDLLGSASVAGARGAYTVEADCAFTGINPTRLLPGKGDADLGGQAEASGRVSLSLPLTADAETLLQRMSLRADITKVGPRTLERLLYALDPQEQNESIVQQRRLMGIGYPRNLRLGLAYGNLSLSGEVEVKGFRLDLPRIDRLPAGNLPVRAQLSKALAPVPALVKTLDAASSGGICRDAADKPGALKAVQNPAQEGGPR